MIKCEQTELNTLCIVLYCTHSSTSSNIYIKASRIELQKHAFSRIGASLWNEIPRNLRELPKKSFKAKIEIELLSVLYKETAFLQRKCLSSDMHI